MITQVLVIKSRPGAYRATFARTAGRHAIRVHWILTHVTSHYLPISNVKWSRSTCRFRNRPGRTGRRLWTGRGTRPVRTTTTKCRTAARKCVCRPENRFRCDNENGFVQTKRKSRYVAVVIRLFLQALTTRPSWSRRTLVRKSCPTPLLVLLIRRSPTARIYDEKKINSISHVKTNVLHV